MNITLFGGSFNPPHLGHLLVISQAFELIPQLDYLWILPAFRHTFAKNLAPAEQRSKMCQLLLAELPPKVKSKVKLCNLEIDYRTAGETYTTLQLLKSETAYLQQKNLLPNSGKPSPAKYSFLMGSDQIKSFSKWGHWQQLLSQMHFYIYPRAGYRNAKPLSNMSFLSSADQVITNLSSTLIRSRLKNHSSLLTLLSPSVLKYIESHHLYQ